MTTYKPEFENGKLVKLNGMRPEYMGGYSLIQAVKQFAEENARLIGRLQRISAEGDYTSASLASEVLSAAEGEKA